MVKAQVCPQHLYGRDGKAKKTVGVEDTGVSPELYGRDGKAKQTVMVKTQPKVVKLKTNQEVTMATGGHKGHSQSSTAIPTAQQQNSESSSLSPFLPRRRGQQL